MFKDYIATKEDLRAVEEALELTIHPKMKFVFSGLSKIIKTLVVSYDSKYVYVWNLNPIKLTKISHNLTILDKWQSGWWAGIVSKEMKKYLPKNHTNQIISGGLLTPFIALQKQKNIMNNPYVSKDSYYATIIHEFGHIYWNSYKLWWYSNKKKNLRYLENPKGELAIRLLSPIYLGEIFAFCTEYYASEHLWKNHKRKLDPFMKNRLSILTVQENGKNLDREDSVIQPNNSPHDFAFIMGKIFLNKYPDNWPVMLIHPLKF